MKRPRFALSMILGAMAASMLALGLPPCPHGSAANGGSPNAALICPTSSLAAESHPFNWFERAESAAPGEETDPWLHTIPAPHNPSTAMRLEACDLSVVSKAPAVGGQATEQSIAQLALEVCGLAWAEELGWCPDFVYGAPPANDATTVDASAVAADYRHSTGHSDALRINLHEGRPPRVARLLIPAPPADLPVNKSFEESLAFDVVLTTIASSADAYERYYLLEQSADRAAAWMHALAGKITSGLTDIMELAATMRTESPAVVNEEIAAVPDDSQPLHTISVVRRSEEEDRDDGEFELVSDSDSRFVFVRSSPAFLDYVTPAADDIEPSVTNSFELVIDGPDRFLFLRKSGFEAPAVPASRSVSVLLPRPTPAGAGIGRKLDCLAWDYLRLQVTDVMHLAGTRLESHGNLLDAASGPQAWNCLAYARSDSPRDQIAAEEAASSGANDAIQSLIHAQGAAEGVGSQQFAPITNAPSIGCYGADPIGCLTDRKRLRAERWAQSAAWSISRMAIVLEECAVRLREVAAEQAAAMAPATSSENLDSAGRTGADGWLEPAQHSTASQRFLSELYLGL